MKYHFNPVSGNAKTGPIPVTMTEQSSCPSACPLKNSGCYAELGNVRIHWNNVEKPNKKGTSALDIDALSAFIRTIPKGSLWRMNVAGDLAHNNETINGIALVQLIQANKGLRGFTYTHHEVLHNANNRVMVKHANDEGFTINLSANSLEHADKLAALNIGPVVTIVPENSPKVQFTPSGRYVIQCPATYQDGVTCANCGICQVSTRKAIIGFSVHGTSKKKAQKVFVIHSVKA